MAKINKWLETVIQNFIDKNQLNGNLSENQVSSFSRNMDGKEHSFYGRNWSTYVYQYGDYTFKVWDNKFSIVNENSWEKEKIRVAIESCKQRLAGATRTNNIESIERHEAKLIELENELKELELV